MDKTFVKAGIQFKMDEEANSLLTKYSKKSGRPKRVEARMRLKDHLLRFEALTGVGNCQTKEPEPSEIE